MVYRGKTVHVIEAGHAKLRVEGRDGQRTEVCAVDVRPGRLKHSKTTTGSFDTIGDALHTGQWVWIEAEAAEKEVDARAQRLLAVVDRLEGPLVYCVSALDGYPRATTPERPQPLSENATAGLERHKAFRNFKLAVTQGRNTRRLAPGRRFVLTVLGHDRVGQAHTTRARRRMPGVGRGEFHHIRVAGGVSEERQLAAGLSFGGFGGEVYGAEEEGTGDLCLVPLGPSAANENRMQTLANDRAEETMATALVPMSTAIIDAPGAGKEPVESTSNTPMFVGLGIGALAVVYLMR